MQHTVRVRRSQCTVPGSPSYATQYAVRSAPYAVRLQSMQCTYTSAYAHAHCYGACALCTARTSKRACESVLRAHLSAHAYEHMRYAHCALHAICAYICPRAFVCVRCLLRAACCVLRAACCRLQAACGDVCIRCAKEYVYDHGLQIHARLHKYARARMRMCMCTACFVSVRRTAYCVLRTAYCVAYDGEPGTVHWLRRTRTVCCMRYAHTYALAHVSAYAARLHIHTRKRYAHARTCTHMHLHLRGHAAGYAVLGARCAMRGACCMRMHTHRRTRMHSGMQTNASAHNYNYTNTHTP